MKKLSIFTVLALTVFLSNCAKEDTKPAKFIVPPVEENDFVEKKNQSVIINTTATDYYNCGNWGWGIRDYLINNVSYTGKAKVISAYVNYVSGSSKLNTSIADNWYNKFNLKPLPCFGVNFFSNTFYPYIDETQQDIDDAITYHDNSTVYASTKFDYHKEGSLYVINTTTQFYESCEGAFYVGIYFIEDNVIANQSGATGSNSNVHRNVLRASNSVYGVQIVNSSNIKPNSIYKKTINMPINTSWNENNLSLVAIIWNYDSGNWNFVNSNWN